MSKDIPLSYTALDSRGYRARSPATANQWQDLCDQQNHLFAHTGARWGGHYFDPAYTTDTSQSLTQANETTGQLDLDHYDIHGICDREISGSNVTIGAKMYGSDISLELRIENVATSTSVGTIVLSNTFSTPAFEVANISISVTDVRDVNGDPQLLRCQLFAQTDTDGETAKLYFVQVFEEILNQPSDLPTNR